MVGSGSAFLVDEKGHAVSLTDDQRTRLAAAIETEKAGKNRTTLLSKLQAIVDAS